MTFSTDWRQLGSPKLTAQARKYLHNRAVEADVIAENNLRSLRPEETAHLWGIRSEALLIPYASDYGTARIFDMPPREDGKFRSTPNKGSRIYEPKLPEKRFKGLTKEQVREDPNIDQLGVEGPVKALAAVSAGLVAHGIAGCWNWQRDRQPLRGLLRYKWRGRKVTPIFDADISENNGVLLPFLLFGDWLQTQKANVQYLKLPGRAGGLDDYLKKHGRAGFDALPRASWDCDKLEELRLSALRTTEGGLAALFALQCRDDVRFDPTERNWYVWNGRLWVQQPVSAPDVQENMKATVAWIIDEANKIKNKDRRTRMLKWAIGCDSKKSVRGATDLASSDPRLRVSVSQLDKDPLLLGTHSGVIDLRTGKLVRSVRDHMVTRSVATVYDPDTKCPRWERFIAEIMLNDHKMIAFMQRLAGYLLLGGNPLRLIFFLYGEGRNGKSVFIELLLKLFGDYGTPAKSSLVMKQRIERDHEGAQPFMLKLRGMRYITASEVGEGMQLDGAVVKTLTGGDEMTVRGLHSTPVRFTVEGKFVIRCNHRPIIDGADQAIWDRVVEIPFNLRLSDKTQDTTLRDTLNAELPGILNWALRGCLEYQKSGLQIPQKVRKQIAAYRDAMDSVAQWLQERTTPDHKAKTEASRLYGSYETWCSAHSRPELPVFAVSRQEFNKRLKDRGYQRKESNSKTYWRGLLMVGAK